MAHFAQLDQNNKVLQVIVISNDVLKNENGDEVEALGIAACQSVFGGGTWVQTSFNKSFRNKYAGEGDVYHPDRDVFTLPQPFPSWSLDAQHKWQPPTPYPLDDNGEGLPDRFWNEETLSWVHIPQVEPTPLP